MGCKFCSETLEKAVVGLSMLSYKSHLFPSLTAFWRKNGVANIINATFKCKLLFRNARKSCRWVKHAFLQKSPFPSLTAFWRKNGVANIINGTFKCKFCSEM